MLKIIVHITDVILIKTANTEVIAINKSLFMLIKSKAFIFVILIQYSILFLYYEL